MTGFVLDTNVVSETTRELPDRRVVEFLDQPFGIWLPSMVVHELEFGLQLLPAGQRRDRLAAAHERILRAYGERILAMDRPAAEWAARFRADARRIGRVLDLGDALIAGTARANDLAIATRNVRDFEGLDVEVVNPWEPLPPTTSP